MALLTASLAYDLVTARLDVIPAPAQLAFQSLRLVTVRGTMLDRTASLATTLVILKLQLCENFFGFSHIHKLELLD